MISLIIIYLAVSCGVYLSVIIGASLGLIAHLEVN